MTDFPRGKAVGLPGREIVETVFGHIGDWGRRRDCDHFVLLRWQHVLMVMLLMCLLLSLLMLVLLSSLLLLPLMLLLLLLLLLLL